MKTISKHIPAELLDYNNVSRMGDLLDDIQLEKRKEINQFNRSYKTVLNPYKRRLLDKIAEFGIPLPPEDYPLILLQSIVLNGGEIQRLRGSIKGIKRFVQSATLGFISNIDASGYFPVFPFIFPNDIHGGGGFLPEGGDVTIKHLIDPDDITLDSVLTFDLETYFFDNPNVIDYIETSLFAMMPFFEGTDGLTINWVAGVLHPVSGMPSWVNGQKGSNNITAVNPETIYGATADLFIVEGLTSSVSSWTSKIFGSEATVNFSTPDTAQLIDYYVRFNAGLSLEIAPPSSSNPTYTASLCIRVTKDFNGIWPLITTDLFKYEIDGSFGDYFRIYVEGFYDPSDPRTWLSLHKGEFHVLTLSSISESHTMTTHAENLLHPDDSITARKDVGTDGFFNLFDISTDGSGFIDISGIIISEGIQSTSDQLSQFNSFVKPKISF